MSDNPHPIRMTTRNRRLRYAGRKTIWGLLIAAVAAVLFSADRAGLFGVTPPADLEKYDGKTFRVIFAPDGDTLHIDIRDGSSSHTAVRLWGIDTPECTKPDVLPQHFALAAAAFTRSLTEGKTVMLRLDAKHTRDKYNRVLAYVYLQDGKMLNRLLIEEGYGYADPRFEHKYDDEFKLLQDTARHSGRGLWQNIKIADLPYYLRDKIKLAE